VILEPNILLKFIITSLCIISFINMKWYSSSLLIFGLNSVLSYVNVLTPTWFQGQLALDTLSPSFHPKPILSLLVRCSSCKQEMIRTCFLVQPAILCLFITEFRPLIININIKGMYYCLSYCVFIHAAPS
jgi:hypothetical protein